MKNWALVTPLHRRVRQHRVRAEVRLSRRQSRRAEEHPPIRTPYDQERSGGVGRIHFRECGERIGGDAEGVDHATRVVAEIAVVVAIERACQPCIQKCGKERQSRGDDQEIPQRQPYSKRARHARRRLA